MHYLALATDYDGTLATNGQVEKTTIKALQNFRQSGRKLILVTGRLLDDLLHIFSKYNLYELFDQVVAENGAVLYSPITKKERLLTERANKDFIRALEKQKLKPLSVGRSIVATCEPNEVNILETIRKLGLELEVIFNKGAIMVLPAGINKETGLKSALSEMGLSLQNVVAVGDAENDHAFLKHSGCSVVVANAIDSLKAEADFCTAKSEGPGVIELIEMILKDDLQKISRKINRHQVLIGKNSEGKKIRFNPHYSCALLAGPSGSGKTTATTAILERVFEKGNQFCVIDPEGDYQNYPFSVPLGGPHDVPRIDEIINLLEHFENPVVNLLGISLMDRPAFFASLLIKLQEFKMRTGRPHWIVIDEAHHLFPKKSDLFSTIPSNLFSGSLLVTVHPDKVSSAILSKVNLILTLGDSPRETIGQFVEARGGQTPFIPQRKMKTLNAVAWFCNEGENPFYLRVEPGTFEHDRHRRKYAHGNLEEDSFYFRGPENKLNLRVPNLELFILIGKGVDDDTWLFHLKRHDYSRWIGKAIQDNDLASKIEWIESKKFSPQKSRDEIFTLIEKTYTANS